MGWSWLSAPCTRCRHCQSADALSPFLLKHLPRREDAGQTHSIANGQVRHHAPQSRLCDRPRRDQRRDRLFLRRPTPPYSPRSPVLPERAPHQRQRAVRVGSGPTFLFSAQGTWAGHCFCPAFQLPFVAETVRVSCVSAAFCLAFALPFAARTLPLPCVFAAFAAETAPCPPVLPLYFVA